MWIHCVISLGKLLVHLIQVRTYVYIKGHTSAHFNVHKYVYIITWDILKYSKHIKQNRYHKLHIHELYFKK